MDMPDGRGWRVRPARIERQKPLLFMMFQSMEPQRPFAPQALYRPALKIVRTLREAGFEAYIAGGAVRDYLLGRPQYDLDIATSASPEAIRRLFRRTIPVGESFGVMIVRERGINFEVATFRSEHGYSDGRRPDQVEFCDARSDVKRRDFTVIGARLIRTIGDPEERFDEDRLRMLRALRFAAQLEFEIEARTLQSIRRSAGLLDSVSMERVREELDRIFRAPRPARGLWLLEDSGLLKVIRARVLREADGLPRAQPAPSAEEPEDSLLWRLARHLASSRAGEVPADGTVDWIPADAPELLFAEAEEAAVPETRSPGEESTEAVLYWLAWFLDLAGLDGATLPRLEPKDLASCIEALAPALRMSGTRALRLRAGAYVLGRLPRTRKMRVADQKRLLRHPGLEQARRLAPCLYPEECEELEAWITARLEEFDDSLVIQPLLDGHRLMELGVAPGPRLGQLLHELESQQLEGNIETVNQAREFVRAALAHGAPPGPDSAADMEEGRE